MSLPRLRRVRWYVEETGVPKTRLYDAIAAGELPVYRFSENRGRGPAGLRIAEGDFAKWIQARRESAR